MNSRVNRKLHSVMRVNELFLDERSEINASLINSYIATALSQPGSPHDPAPTINQLSRLAGVPCTTMSRHLRYLGDKERKDKAGMNLVRVNENPDNRREKQVYLTYKGEKLRDRIIKFLT